MLNRDANTPKFPLRRSVLTLTPYSSARDEYEGDAETLLDANENSIGSIISGLEILPDLTRYPDPYQSDLKEALSERLGVYSDQIFVGNGSDEAIDLLVRVFCETGKDNIVICPPTYGMYKVSAAIHDVGVVSAPLMQDFTVDLEEIERAINDHTRLVFLCSPNNPTGNLVALEQISAVLDSFRGIVVVDEAYIDLCPESSAMKLINEFQNLVILRTFSKAYGLAAIRVGMAIGSSEVVELLNKIKPPYNVNSLSQQIALQALNQQPRLAELTQQLNKERKYLQEKLSGCVSVTEVHPSNANFLLVRFKDSSRALAALRGAGIIVRDRSRELNCENCLRITVGNRAQNDQLLSVLKSLSPSQL